MILWGMCLTRVRYFSSLSRSAFSARLRMLMSRTTAWRTCLPSSSMALSSTSAGKVCDYIHAEAQVAEGGSDAACVIGSVLQDAPSIGVVPNCQGQAIPHAFDSQIALAIGALRAETEGQE